MVGGLPTFTSPVTTARPPKHAKPNPRRPSSTDLAFPIELLHLLADPNDSVSESAGPFLRNVVTCVDVAMFVEAGKHL